MARSIAGAVGGLTASPGLLGAFRGQFGGNTKAMAQAVGVSQRTVQRWLTKGKEQRKPGKAVRAKMARRVPVKANVKGKFSFDTPGGSSDNRDRDIDFELDSQELAELMDAVRAGDDEAARELFFEAYGMAAPDQVLGADYSFNV